VVVDNITKLISKAIPLLETEKEEEAKKI